MDRKISFNDENTNNENNNDKNENEKKNFIFEKIQEVNNLIDSNENFNEFEKIKIEKEFDFAEISENLIDFIMNFHRNFLEKIEEKKEIEIKNIELDLYLKELTSKCEDLNKYIDVLYKSIHSVLILSDSTKEKINIVKCEPVPSYLRFINNTIN